MRTLLLVFLLSGCATGEWTDYNYGPGDWLNDNTALIVDTMDNYVHLVEPSIEVHHVKSLSAYCGTMWAQGCAILQDGHCDIYVGEVYSADTIAHEERHCRGWTHYQPHYESYMKMGSEFRAREATRASTWFPQHPLELQVAMNKPRFR